MNKEEHRKLLSAFEVDRLLKIMTIEAKKSHGGHFTIFSFTTHFKAGFGTPDLFGGDGYGEVAAMRPFDTLKEALINALVEDARFEIDAIPRRAKELCWQCAEDAELVWDGEEAFHLDLTEKYRSPCTASHLHFYLQLHEQAKARAGA